MPNSSRNEIYDAAIRRLVKLALEEQEQQFAQEHASDTDEQLADYLTACASKLGHIPWPQEIVGGVTIQNRFGTWEAALHRAGLSQPNTPDRFMQFARVQKEVERQKVVYRQRKAEKKRKAEARLKAQAQKRKNNTEK